MTKDFMQYLGGLNLGWTVSFFFFLSGFVLSFSRDGKFKTNSDIAAFLFERVFRLWPLHVVCGAIAALTIGWAGSFVQYYLFVTLQHSWVPGYYTGFFLNGVSWSISNEFFFYILFPFFMILPTARLLAVVTVWMVICYGSMTFISLHPTALPFTLFSEDLMKPGISVMSFFYLFPPIRFVEFAAGMATYRAYRVWQLPTGWVVWAQLVVLLLTFAFAANFGSIMGYAAQYLPLDLAIANVHYGMFPLFALLVFVFAHQEGFVSRALSNRVFVYLGEISFSTYMIHQIVINNLVQNFGIVQKMGAAWSIATALVISLAASALLYHLVERPGLAFGKRWTRLMLNRSAAPRPS